MTEFVVRMPEDEYAENSGNAFSKIFYEPAYGWSGFDEEVFRETLEDGLANLSLIKIRLSTANSLAIVRLLIILDTFKYLSSLILDLLFKIRIYRFQYMN